MSKRRALLYQVLATVWITLILVLLGFYLVQTYRATDELISHSSRNEATVLSQTMDAALRRISAVAEWVEQLAAEESHASEAVTSDRALARLRDGLDAHSRYFPEIHGYLLTVPDEEDPAAAIAAGQICSDVVAAAVTGAQQALQTSGVMTFSESLECGTSLTRVMMVHRAISGPSGPPVAVLTAIVDLSHFETLFSRIDVGRSGMVSMRRIDTSRLVVRWPVLPDRLNNPAPTIPPQRAVEQGIPSGVVRYVGATDGVNRIFAYDRVGDFPFYVLVGRSVREQFAAWWIMSGSAVVVSFMIVGFSLVLLRRLRHEAERLSEAEQTVRQVLVQKEALIRELLHRTNNSLQVVRSLVHLEALASPVELAALSRLDYRIRALSLIQQMLNEENHYTWIDLGAYLELLRDDLCDHDASSACCLVDAVPCVLDIAAPVGLIVAELLRCSGAEGTWETDTDDGPPVEVRLTRDTDTTATLSYRDVRTVHCSSDTQTLLAALAEHQLMGRLVLSNGTGFRCTVQFSLHGYRPRIAP